MLKGSLGWGGLQQHTLDRPGGGAGQGGGSPGSDLFSMSQNSAEEVPGLGFEEPCLFASQPLFPHSETQNRKGVSAKLAGLEENQETQKCGSRCRAPSARAATGDFQAGWVGRETLWEAMGVATLGLSKSKPHRPCP